MEAKTCIRCSQSKPLSAFYRRKDNTGQTYRTVCKDCEREYKTQWWQEHPEQNKTYKENKRRGINTRTANPYHKRRWILRKASIYQVAPSVIDALILKSEGRCEVCEITLTGFGVASNAMCIDHNHTTNELRGVLCPGCNAAIGHLKETPAFAEHAARYLRRIAGPG